jgi:hypothetical protein
MSKAHCDFHIAPSPNGRAQRCGMAVSTLPDQGLWTVRGGRRNQANR